MFTLGFRVFALFSVVAVASAIIYGIATGDTGGKDYFGVVDLEAIKGVFSLGWQGGVGEHLGYVIFVFLAFATLALGVILIKFRDASPTKLADLAEQESAPEATTTAVRNFWPLITVAGVAVSIVGLITNASVVVTGIILSAVAGLEWAIFAWSERLTADPVTNRQIRNRLMAPIEIPVLGAAAIAILALGASRVFLAVSELNAVWVGTGISVIIFLGAVFLASKPKISQRAISAILVVLAVAVIAIGIVSAAVGTRDIHHEPAGQVGHGASGEEATSRETGIQVGSESAGGENEHGSSGETSEGHE